MNFIETWGDMLRMIIFSTFTICIIFGALFVFHKYKIINSIDIKGDGITIGISPWDKITIVST